MSTSKRRIGKRVWKRKAMSRGWFPTGGSRGTIKQDNLEQASKVSPGLLALAMGGIFNRLRTKNKGGIA